VRKLPTFAVKPGVFGGQKMYVHQLKGETCLDIQGNLLRFGMTGPHKIYTYKNTEPQEV